MTENGVRLPYTSTIIYAHMQVVGMVNDQLVDCFRYREIRRLESPPRARARAESPAGGEKTR